MRLQVDAGTAFGSGEHATTQGCLRAIEMLHKQHRIDRVLDMGCGSGILGIAAAKLWHCNGYRDRHRCGSRASYP